MDVEVAARFFDNGRGKVLIGELVTDYKANVVNIARSSHSQFKGVIGEWHSHGVSPLYYDFSREDLINQFRMPVYLSAPKFEASYSGQNLLRAHQGLTCLLSGFSTKYSGC